MLIIMLVHQISKFKRCTFKISTHCFLERPSTAPHTSRSNWIPLKGSQRKFSTWHNVALLPIDAFYRFWCCSLILIKNYWQASLTVHSCRDNTVVIINNIIIIEADIRITVQRTLLQPPNKLLHLTTICSYLNSTTHATAFNLQLCELL